MNANDSQNDSLNIPQDEPATVLLSASETVIAACAPAVDEEAGGSDAPLAKPEKKARAPRKAKAAAKAPAAPVQDAPSVASPDAPVEIVAEPASISAALPAASPKQAPAMIEAPMPTAEQVQKAMAKARRMQFQDECPEQAERARQISEGRRLAQAEGFAPLKHVDERELQIRTGQSLAAQESRQARSPAPRPAAPKNNDSEKDARPAGAKKSRNRNRNRKNRQASPTPGA